MADKRRLGLWEVFSHPVVGVVGTIASVISIPLAVWFYCRSVPTRELAVVEPPVRSVFVNRDAPAALEVRANGAPVIQKDVFAVQLAIWNRGNQSIRPENVLEPLTFVPQGGTKVLDAQVLRRTRDICGIGLQVLPDGGGAGVRWNILEPGDGAIVQLVLMGDQSCGVGVTGTIEGGGRPSYVHISGTSEKGNKQLWSASKSFDDWMWEICLFAIMAGLGLRCAFVLIPEAWRMRSGSRRRKLSNAMVGAVFFLGASYLMGYKMFADLFGGYRVPRELLVETRKPPNGV